MLQLWLRLREASVIVTLCNTYLKQATNGGGLTTGQELPSVTVAVDQEYRA